MIQTTGTCHFPNRARFTDVRQILDHAIESYPTLPAYRYRLTPEGETIEHSYAELKADIIALGAALTSLRESSGEDHIAVMGENCYEWVLAYNAAMFGLGVIVPLDRQLPEQEAENLTRRGNVSYFFFHSRQREIAHAIWRKNPNIQMISMQEDGLDGLSRDEREHFLLVPDLLKKGHRIVAEDGTTFGQAPIDPDKMAALVFTSGTTAMAKGVMLSQRNIAANVTSAYQTIALDPGERALSVLPLHHTFESTVGMYMLWALGCCVCLNDGLRYLAQNMKDWQISALVAVPLLVENIYRRIIKTLEKTGKLKTVLFMRKVTKALRRIGIDIRRKVFAQILDGLGGHIHLCVVGAAALNTDVTLFFNDIGIDCWAGYGLTEGSPVVSVCNQSINVIGSVGPPLSEITVAIDAPEAGRTPDHAGEILVRGENVMLGYYENETDTQEALRDDGWPATGDIGYIDSKNCLHITGRAKSMIVLANGKKAFPEEIEVMLERIPGVTASMSWGEENQRQAVDICAKIQINPEELPSDLHQSDEAIGKYLRESIIKINRQMPVYKAVKHFVWTEDDFVMTTTLKIRRPDEIALLRKRIDQMPNGIRDLDGKRL